MPYIPIPDDELKSDTRVIAPALQEQQATLALLQRFPDVKVYALLLTADPKHPIAQVVRERWSELSHLTGSQTMFIVFEKPDQWSEGLKNYWKKQLGDTFDATWQEWQQGPESGLAFDYLDLFEEPRLRPDQLPCLVLFTDPKKREAVARSIPNWDADSLYRLLMGMIGSINECAAQPAETRLACLRDNLSSPSAVVAAQLGHTGGQALTYLRQHPAQIVTTSLSFALALGTASVVPLSPVVVGILQALKGALAPGKSP